MKKIDISIIVPIYNSEKYLKKCIESLINQTKKELEFILINDGSTDDSEKIIKEYKDERIRYFKNKNQGIGKTRNLGIEKATGNYIMFIDSDDYITLDCCQLFYDHAKKTKADLIVSDYYKDKNGIIESIKIASFKDSSLIENKDLILKINPGPCNKLFKRDLIINNRIKFNEQYKYEDAPFVMESILKSNKISKLNEPLSFYCIHENSETTVRDKRIFDILSILDIIRNKMIEVKGIKENLDIFTVDMITNYTIQQRYQKNRKIRNDFIDACFKYMENNISDYKDKKYYNNKSYLRRKIESNKFLTKIYCSIANIKYR